MHRAVGMAITAVGVLCALFGAALMLILGPDGRLTTGPHHLDTDGIAVVTAPTLITWKNLQVEILAEVPVNKPVFVGIGNSVDVQSYLSGISRLEVTEFNTPWSLRTRKISGKQQLQGAPTAMEWWTAQSAGLGGASINTTLPDETVSAAVLSVGASNLRGLTVTVAYGLKGAFFKGLGFLLGGIGVAWAGVLARQGVTIWKTDDDGGLAAASPEHEEEVIYIWVDDDGVEHQMTEEEAAEHEIVEHIVIEHHVKDHDVAQPPPIEPESAAEEPARYFWVDDDGVEHEVHPDDLHEFEIYDPPLGDESFPAGGTPKDDK